MFDFEEELVPPEFAPVDTPPVEKKPAPKPTRAEVEAESAAVAQVCRRLGVPFACLKVISDGCDDGEYADFKQAAADKAVRGVLALVRGRRA